MTIEKLNQIGFIVNNNNEIEPLTYRKYLREYAADETTSPRGVEPRLHIRKEDENTFEIWDWGMSGNHPYFYGYTFDNEEDAELFLFECWENERYSDKFYGQIFF